MNIKKPQIDIETLLRTYDLDKVSIATLASHSSLQIFHGAKLEGFKTIAIVTEDRIWFYRQFNHLIDRFIVVNNWRDICKSSIAQEVRVLNGIMVPHGSYVEYLGIECAEALQVPIFGLRNLFRIEYNQWAKMEFLERAGIPIPRIYKMDEDINVPVIVKFHGAKGGRGYHVAKSRDEIAGYVRHMIERGVIRGIDEVMIQEYLVGVTAYYHYFYSPIFNRVEILGADIRYESDIDGIKRIPHRILIEMDMEPTFTVIGNIPLVLRESLLPKILEYGIKFVEESVRTLPPGIIGPFCLESVVDKDMNIRVFEFSGRIVAGTNAYIWGSPYSYLYWPEPMSMGRRIAREVKLAISASSIRKILT
ncbi:MAG: formate--phosphoribosylaminoimidazolecarboxamide ligase [Ignisphaera sp.]|nr:formate--phosphoribosylaminoimidazolecarboxamide ligase [Ignisphaera sp.]MCX8167506.1 formate--phosphoribosylaminoimidazolecarboxamide ligase [Ignisphaera sp.]MDW8084631.1 formate--phosphoribosylaminoimidazolecarboxamide ligase [Ignisphaera sp.]